MTTAQLAAATAGAAYAGDVLIEQGFDIDPEGEVRPDSLAGLSADGRSLSSLVLTPVVLARGLIDRGMSPRRAMEMGLKSLERIVLTEIPDAGRVASGIGVTTRPTVGYVRMVNPPSCPRCAILAGRFYRYSSGFERHPNCSCVHIPAPENRADALETNPRRLLEEGQIRGLSKADTKAILEDGADMNRVVNAHRGMYTASGNRRLTTERSRLGRQRLRPETIYREASSREEAISLLRLHGYIA
jgi:hypothetical protein